MLNAKLITTVLFVYVAQDLLGILTLFAKNVSNERKKDKEIVLESLRIFLKLTFSSFM